MAIDGTVDAPRWTARSVTMRSGFALVVLAARVAAADSSIVTFLQVAPSRDGGAWLLVRAESGELRRIAPDGTMGLVTAPTDRAIRAIAASPFDDSLWVLTDGPLLERAADGAWRRVLLSPEPAWGVWYGHTSAVITPIAPHRAVVFRGCGYECTDVSVIDAGSRSAEARRFSVLLGPAAADGRGGLWAIVHDRHDQGDETTLTGGYAHFHDTWDAWTEASAPLDGMAMHHAQIVPTAIAGDGRGGAIVATDDELATIGPDGTVTNRGSIASPREHPARLTRSVIAAGDEALVVAEESRHDGLDPSPVVRHVALAPIREREVERVPTSASWRAEHSSGNVLETAAAGATTWIVTADAIFYRSAGGWKTVAGRGAETTRKILASAPLEVGLATRPSTANGVSLGLRPEVIFPFDHPTYPIYGVGPYAEAVFADGAHAETLFGGGLTGIVYGDMWAVALSAGADARHSNGSTHPQLAVSAFIGLREYNMHLFDAPLGLRVDARPGTASVPGSVTFSLAVDAGWLVGLGYAVTAPFRSD